MNKITLDHSQDYLIWREGSGNTVEIFDLLVMSDRRVGMGRKLVDILIEKVTGEADLIFAFTRPSNRISQKFYTGIGFLRMGVLYSFYRNETGSGTRYEDTIIWGRKL